MVAYSFKPRFAEPILAGSKGGTIRANRKRHARPGEELQLYTGMRTRQCRLIARKQCVEVEPIELWLGADMVEFRNRIFRRNLDLFARFDGFSSWHELCDFWLYEHGDARFIGVHIRWLPLPAEFVA
jgi:hypothetical protein